MAAATPDTGQELLFMFLSNIRMGLKIGVLVTLTIGCLLEPDGYFQDC